ncbi:MAG: radical SAM protein [Candidatus Kaelpia aquatica]|nr:radical SAM protein [Candidatus Kaelpia aquatica]
MKTAAFPKYLMIQTVSGCNGSCYFCPHSYLEERTKSQQMDFKIFKKIIDECKDHKDLKVVMPYLMNEPLLDREIDKKIAYIKKRLPQSLVHILTNGSLLDENMGAKLIESGIDWVGFSLHGITENTIKETMGLDSEKVLNNISNFMKIAQRDKKDIADFIMLTLIKNERLPEEEFEDAVSFWKRKGIKRISSYSHPISRAGNVPLLDKVRNEGLYGCNSIWVDEMMHVLSNGDVVLCCMDWNRDVLLGNIEKDSLYNIWHSKKYNNLRDQINGKVPAEKKLICLKCECAQTESKRENNSITLIIPPPWGVERPPVGLAVIAEVLRVSGYRVKIMDLNLKIYSSVNEDDKKYWGMDCSLYFRDKKFIDSLMEKYADLFSEIENDLKNDDSGIAAFSVPTNSMYLMLKWMIEKIKYSQPQKKIVLGGISVTVKEQRDEFFEMLGNFNLIDAVVLGEGEDTILKLAHKLSNNRPIVDVENTVIVQGGNFIETGPGNVDNLDRIPFPKYEGFLLKEYTENNSISLELSRGCIGRCSFCSFKILSSSYKRKSPQRVIAELKYYKKELKKEYFSIVDSSINSDLKWLEKLSELIIKEALDLKLAALAIPRGDMSLDLLKKMKRAGFYRLEYGVESGSSRILKLMGKTFLAEDARRALSLTKRANIQNVLYFIVGFPTESDDDFQETLDFIRLNKANIDYVKSVNPLFLMAGSEIFANPEKFNISLPSESPDVKWFIGRGNDFDFRMKRVKRVHELLRELNIPYTTGATALPDKSIQVKKKDVALITTAPWGVNNPPLALGYLSDYLKKNNYDPAVFDFNIEFYNSIDQELQHLWHVENKNFWRDEEWFNLILKIFDRDIDLTVNKILESGAKIIGFSVVDPKERLTIEFIKRIKAKDSSKNIILGGPATLTAHSRNIFIDNIAEHIDFFVVGEGEETLLEIMKDENCNDIPGAIRVTDGKPGRLKEREVIKDLDSISYPSYEDFDLNLYPGKSLILEWSRGCVGNCAFCINHELIKGYRSRSAEHIFQELKYHKDINGISNFTVCDPLLNGKPQILEQLCNKIIEDGLKIEWTGEAMPRKDMEITLLEKMKEAGCVKLQIGLESGSDKVLKRMRKSYDVKTAEDFLRKASLAGMETELFVMIGFPSEDEAEFQKTADFLRRNREYINTLKSINTLHLIAGTDLYKNYSEFKINSLPDDNWHYLWETEDGNNYTLRRERGESLLKLAEELGFKVMETNLDEGKQQKEDKVDISRLEVLVNRIQHLPKQRKDFSGEALIPRKRILKLPYLILIIVLTLAAETYLWILKKIRRIIIFPGS